ncbi:MAG: hypothetical protein V4662_24205 [Verrucomicrobiota bacterium]
MKPNPFGIIFGWAFMLLASHAFGQGTLPDGYPEQFVDHGPDGFLMLFWIMAFVFMVVCCVAVGVGLAVGLVILAGFAAMFGAGGMIASLVGGLTSRKPRVGWRIFSMWMHAGLLTLAGIGIGGFVVPFFWPGQPTLPTAAMGAAVGLVAGVIWGWLLALGVERCGGIIKEAILPGLKLKAESDKLAIED